MTKWESGEGRREDRPAGGGVWVRSSKQRKGDEIALGFDGSRKRHAATTDATALIGVVVETGYIFVPLGGSTIWQAPPGPEGKGWTAPRDAIDEAVRECFELYNVGAAFFDPHEWRDELASWEGDYGEQVRVKAPGAGGPFTWWPTEKAMTLALEAFYDAIVNGSASHDGNPFLRRHVLAAHRYPTRYGYSVKKEHPTSSRKIDGLVAAAQAWSARLALVAAGPVKQRSGRVW